MKTRASAAVGSAVFFVLAPGGVVGLGPWLVTGWEFNEPLPYWVVAQVVGAILIGAGVWWCVHAFVRFSMAKGTPAPVAPTEHLVVEGPNRFIRNPMYFALLGAVIGQALLFGSWGLVVYTAFFWALTAAFVRWYEEPTLARQFGEEYETYRRNVPAWLPRLTPWTPTGQSA